MWPFRRKLNAEAFVAAGGHPIVLWSELRTDERAALVDAYRKQTAALLGFLGACAAKEQHQMDIALRMVSEVDGGKALREYVEATVGRG